MARMRIVAGALSAAGLMAGMAAAQGGAPQVTLEEQVLVATNEVRAANDLPPLRAARPLNKAARGHSTFLAKSGLFQHEDAAGKPFWHRIVKAGYPSSSSMAENIAMVPGCSPEAVAETMQLWMDSPPHRRNILNGKMRAVGISAVASEDCSEVYYTVDFGSVTSR